MLDKPRGIFMTKQRPFNFGSRGHCTCHVTFTVCSQHWHRIAYPDRLHMLEPQNNPLPSAFHQVLRVQFVSSLADNALLIVAIARTMELGADGWRVPLLKMGFTLFYVLLAPIVGPVADSMRKGRVMLMANLFKTCALMLLLAGSDPLLVIAIVGWGSAAYAPAKYGLMTELLPPGDLVRANGFFEGATVSAVILGTVLGGFLVSPHMPTLVWPVLLQWQASSSTAYAAGMLFLLLLNALASTMSLGIVDSGARYARASIAPKALFRRFWQDNMLLWRDPLGGISMAVTTLLWGVGATLQLIVLRWSHESLGLPLADGAYLQGVTAVGVVAGAIWASRYVTLGDTLRLLPIGIVLGLMIPVLLWLNTIAGAVVLLVTVGALAGFFVVPMNALLQHRGHGLLTAGRSIAVQGFNENAGMLLMLAAYAGAIAFDLSLNALIASFGALVVLGMVLIYGVQSRSAKCAQAPT
jgi:MFS transporter, LPLT family, lysophospholipid transporter